MLCPICQFDNPPQSKHCGTCGAVLGSGAKEESTTHPDTLPTGTLLAGTYRVEALLGQGGFGITYRCHDQMLDRPVAIKEFFPSGCRRQGSTVLPSRGLTDTDFREARAQFLAEARLLARCHHNGIVSVHSAFEANETAYMVMELLHGQSLAQLIDARGGRLPEDEAVDYIERTGLALQFVHDQDLLHRDIKPENIIVCDDGRVMLIDFGTAREYSKGQAQGHTIVVTPGYAPLEQYARQAKRGAFTDVYGLAATLYDLLTGQAPPAASDRAMGVLLRPVRQENAQISASVARAVEAGLQMEIAKRPQSVHEFLDLLKAPVEEDSPDYALEAPVVDEDVPKKPSLGRPVALLSDANVALRPDANQELQDWLDTIQNEPAHAIPLVPYTFSIDNALRTDAHSTNAISQPVAPMSPSVPTFGASAGPIYKNTARPGSSNAALWLVAAFFIILIFCDLLVNWKPAPRPEPYSYTTTATTYDYQPAPPVSVPAPRFISEVAPENTSPAILPVSIETLPGSVNTGVGGNSPTSYSFMSEMAAFSADGQLLAYVDSKATVRVWDMRKQRALRSFPSNKEHLAVSVLFSHDNESVVVTYQSQGKTHLNDQIRAWNLRTGQLQATLSLKTDKEQIWPQAALPDGKIIVRQFPVWNGQKSKTPSSTFLWDARSGQQSGVTARLNSDGEITRIVASPNGREMVAGDNRGVIRWFDTRSGVEKRKSYTSMTYADYQSSPLFKQNTSYQFQAIPGGVSLSDSLGVHTLRFSTNGNWLASRNDAQIRVFDSQAQETGSISIGHSPLFAVSPDGKSLVASGGWYAPEEVGLWNVKENQKSKLAGAAGQVVGLDFSPDGQKVRCVSNDGGTLRLITWKTDGTTVSVFGNPQVETFQSSRMYGPVEVFSNQMIANAGPSSIEIRQPDGQLEKTIGPISGIPKALKISSDGQFLATLGRYGTVQLWNVQTQKLVTQQETGKGTRQDVTSLEQRRTAQLQAMSRPMAFSPDSQHFAYAWTEGDLQTIEIWDLKNGPHHLASLPIKGQVTSLTLSPDNRSVVCGMEKGVEWYRIATKQLQAKIKTEDSVAGLSFTPDKLVVLGRSTTKLYALPDKLDAPQLALHKVAQISIPFAWARSLRSEMYWCLSKDGTMLATMEQRDKIRIWQLTTGTLLQVLDTNDRTMSLTRSLTFSPDGTQLTALIQHPMTQDMQIKSWSRPATK